MGICKRLYSFPTRWKNWGIFELQPSKYQLVHWLFVFERLFTKHKHIFQVPTFLYDIFIKSGGRQWLHLCSLFSFIWNTESYRSQNMYFPMRKKAVDSSSLRGRVAKIYFNIPASAIRLKSWISYLRIFAIIS